MNYKILNNKYLKRIFLIIILIFLYITLSIINKLKIPTINKIILKINYYICNIDFLKMLFISFLKMFLGFLFSLIFSVSIAIISYKNDFVKQFIYPLFTFIKVIPTVFIILISLLFIKYENIYLIVCLITCSPIIYENVLVSLEDKNQLMEEVVYVYNINIFKKIKYLILPRIIINLRNSMHQTVSLSVKSVLASEIIANKEGNLGNLLLQNKNSRNIDNIFAIIIIVLIISSIYRFIILKTFDYIARYYFNVN